MKGGSVVEGDVRNLDQIPYERRALSAQSHGAIVGVVMTSGKALNRFIHPRS